jgi:hypothetical protein
MLQVGATGIEDEEEGKEEEEEEEEEEGEEKEKDEVYLTNVPLTQFVLNDWMTANTGSEFLWKEVMVA